tara:strand:- start:1298 stop:1930 length:633 start_codon:yes stop_codon:yes gene_type:complete
MKTKNNILFAEKMILSRFDTLDSKIIWAVDLEKKITGVTRIDHLIFVTTISKWGIGQYTSLLNFDTGEILWMIKKVFISILITDQYVFSLQGSKLEALSVKTGKEHFIISTTFKWTSPKLALIGERLYLYSKKKVLEVNQKNGQLMEVKSPKGIDLQSTTCLVDEFQMSINTITTPDSGVGFVGDMGGLGGDASGGDGGSDGGGDGGGGE